MHAIIMMYWLRLGLPVLLCVFIALPSGLAAQGISGLETQSRQGRAGPYAVDADARELPSLQAVQFFIRVADADGGTPAEGLQVTVHTSRRGGGETGWAHAFSPNVPGLYQSTVALEEAGVWEMTVEIARPNGGSWFLVADNFVFETVEVQNDIAAGLVFLGVAVVLIIGAGYLVWRIRRNQRQRAARSDTAAA